MGGRGGAGGGIGAVRSAVEHSEFWESAKSNAYLGAENCSNPLHLLKA